MAGKASKHRGKAKRRAKAKAATQSRSKSKAAKTPASQKRKPASTRRQRPQRDLALRAGPGFDAIIDVAANSPVARIRWPGRGVAPMGYVKGMALAFARVHCKLRAGDAIAVEMARAKRSDATKDALTWYDDEFRALGLSNDVDGPETLRHLFALMIGLGMRESSGRFCEGRDRSATNTTASTAEAGLFQTSFNARSGSPLLPPLFDAYTADPRGFVDIFREGVRCTARDLENFGTGAGARFQNLSKDCPAFAVEFAAVGLRNFRRHWGPINRKEAELRSACVDMLRDVQAVVDARNLCPSVR